MDNPLLDAPGNEEGMTCKNCIYEGWINFYSGSNKPLKTVFANKLQIHSAVKLGNTDPVFIKQVVLATCLSNFIAENDKNTHLCGKRTYSTWPS